MDKQQISVIESVKKEVAELFENEFSGHDMLHTMRVLNNALRLQTAHGGDRFIITLSALLHDADDKKLSPKTHKELDNARRILGRHDVAQETVEKILAVIKSVSFSDGKEAETLEAQIVQDADRLDALGAVGIARCFAWGGAHNRAIYSENDDGKTLSEDGNSGIAHFFQKLLKLEAMMNTETGREEAKKRTVFLKEFLLHFSQETQLSFNSN